MKKIKLFLNLFAAAAVISSATSCMQDYEPSADVVALREAQIAKLEAETAKDSAEAAYTAELAATEAALREVELKKMQLGNDSLEMALELQFQYDSLANELKLLQEMAAYDSAVSALNDADQERVEELREMIAGYNQEILALSYDTLIIQSYKALYDQGLYYGDTEEFWLDRFFRSDFMDDLGNNYLLYSVIGLAELIDDLPFDRDEDYLTVKDQLIPAYASAISAIEDYNEAQTALDNGTGDSVAWKSANQSVKTLLNEIVTIYVVQDEESQEGGFADIENCKYYCYYTNYDEGRAYLEEDDINDQSISFVNAWSVSNSYYNVSTHLNYLTDDLEVRENQIDDYKEISATKEITTLSIEELYASSVTEISTLKELIAVYEQEITDLLGN